MKRVLIDTDILSYYFKGDEIENDMTLITNNESHFNRIPGLEIENWKKQ